MPPQKFRVGGGYTAFSFNGQPILYLEVVRDNAPRPVADPEPIHPLDSQHPIEVAFPKAHTVGSLVLTIREQWVPMIWQQLPGYENATNILEVFSANIASGSIMCSKVIEAPDGSKRTTYYHGCVITAIDESEEVNIRSMTFPKTITVTYTHKTSHI